MDQALRGKMCARMREVQTQVAERDELIEVIAIALLTRKNVFVLGDTGQAKSAVINLFRDGLTGARQFERLMSKQADEEALFGRLDLSSLIPGGVPEEILEEDALYQEMRRDLETLVLNYRRGDASFGQQLELATTELERYRKALSELHGGEPRIITKGKLPDSHIVFLDEIFKSSDGILNALLTALNERRYTNEGKTIHIPTISFFSASNEIPNFTNPEEKMLDESGSAEEAAPWCKAVALALLDIAMRDHRRFAMIHFSGKGHFKTDLFIPQQYDREDVLRAAELFLNGGTDYTTPLQEALRLMEEDGFENADMVFITDGACELPQNFRERLSQEQAKRGFHITGVLLDQDGGAFEFSLAAFCDEIIRTSELTREQVAEHLVSSRTA